MKAVKSLIITQNLELASLWAEDPSLGHEAAVLPAFALSPETALIFNTRFPQIHIFSTPEQALEWGPDVVIATECVAPGYSLVTEKFSQAGIAVVNSSAFLDRLGLDPEVSRNAITSLFGVKDSRRFIPLHNNPLMLQSEAIYYTLRYPEDRYILDIGDTSGNILAITTPEILKDVDRFCNLMRDFDGFFSQRAGGFISHRNEVPTVLFKLTCIHAGSWVGRPILSWQDGVDKMACWLPFQDSPLVQGLEKLAGSWKVKGPLTLECCMDSNGEIQVYRISPGMDSWLWTWLRLKIASVQSWASLWRSVGKGVHFDYLEGSAAPAWVLETSRDSGLLAIEGQVESVWRGFSKDTILGTSPWQYCHFDLTEMSALEQVCQTGLVLKKPLWAAVEITRVEQYLKSWESRPFEMEQVPEEDGTPEFPDPPPEAESQVGEEPEPEIKEEELINVC